MPRKRTNYDIDIPTSWSEITLKKFIEIKKLYDQYDNNCPVEKLIEFLANKEDGYLRDCPALIITKIINKLNFLREPLPQEETNSITINGETYTINTQDELKFGEFVDSQTILQDDADNFPALLAIICRKDGEEYNDEYIAKHFNHRVKMFENISMDQIQPLLNFFFHWLIISNFYTQESLGTLIEEANHILLQSENLVKNGNGSRLSMSLRMMKLRKLRKSLRLIAQQFFNS